MSVQAQDATATEGFFTVQGQQIHCKAYKPRGKAKTTIIFLHGQAFTSENWKEIGTLDTLQSDGIYAFAIDLPGYGKSKDASVQDRGLFLKDVVEYVDGEIKVVVSPSMSGTYSIPYISSHGEDIAGYVPVAPVKMNALSPSKAISKKLHVFAVSGENDARGVNDLSVFEKTFTHYSKLIIEKAGHPAYLDNPELFNSKLIDFALSLSSD